MYIKPPTEIVTNIYIKYIKEKKKNRRKINKLLFFKYLK